MNTRTILIFLMMVMATFLSAQNHQKGDTLIIESETREIMIPAKNITEPKIPVDLWKVPNTVWNPVKKKYEPQIPKQEIEFTLLKTEIKILFNDYELEMKNQKIISDNVIIEVNLQKLNNDLRIVYSYYLINDTLKFQTDDFGPGKYRVDESNALQVTLGIMKNTVEGQLAKYVVPQTKISLTVNGSADATPVRNPIEYKGEFGNPVSEICVCETGSHQMEVSLQNGINDNPTLAFIRSYAVKDYIVNNIDPFKFTCNEWQYSASVSSQRGDKFRRVSIEMIVFDALKNN
jgi:hypothetical protein